MNNKQPPIWYWLALGFIVLFLLVWWILDLFNADSTDQTPSVYVVPTATPNATASLSPITGQTTPGTRIYNGLGVPSLDLGSDGHYYIRRDNGMIYEKQAGGWAIVFDPSSANDADDNTDYLAIYEAND